MTTTDERGWATCVVCSRLRSTLDTERVCARCRKAVDAGHLTIPENSDSDPLNAGEVQRAQDETRADAYKDCVGSCKHREPQCWNCPDEPQPATVSEPAPVDKKQKPVKRRWWNRRK